MFIHLLQRNIEDFFSSIFSIKISDSGTFDLKTSNINFNIKIKIGKTFPFFFFVRNEILTNVISAWRHHMEASFSVM